MLSRVLTWPILLRILLMVGLALNGSGHAAASSHAGSAHANAAHGLPTPSIERSAPAAPPCHEHKRGADPVSEPANPLALAPGTVAEQPSSECCEASACGCPCAQQAAAAVTAAVQVGNAMFGRDGGAGTVVIDRASPRLPHPIRPPIG